MMRAVVGALLLASCLALSGEGDVRTEPTQYQTIFYTLDFNATPPCGRGGTSLPPLPAHHVDVRTNINGWHIERQVPPTGVLRMPMKTVPYRVQIRGVCTMTTASTKLENDQMVHYDIVSLIPGCWSDPITVQAVEEPRGRTDPWQ